MNNDIKQHRDEAKTELSRELSLFHLTMMGAGMMIGAGVFVATGISIGISGSGGILLTFALNGLIAIFSAMSLAELASAMPAAGGAYTYIKRAFGGVIGFLSGWMNWFALAVAGSLYAITFSKYTLHLLNSLLSFEHLNEHLMIYEKILALLVAVVFIYINSKGISETGKSATLIALGQTVTLGIIGVIGIFVAFKEPAQLTNFQPFLSSGWDKIFITMGFTYVGFEGFEVIGHAGEEAIDPKRNIPKAILYAVIIVVTTYLLVAFAAVIGAKPEGATVTQWFHERGATGFADAIKSLFPFGGVLVTLAAIFSSTSALNATIYSSARVSFSMGRDGMLPSKMASISKQKKVPMFALFASSIIILVVAAFLPVEDVAASADIMFLLIFLMINVSVIKIRREFGDELEYGFMMPFFPVIPIIALLAQLLLSIFLLDMSIVAWITTLFWIASGVVLYYTYSKKNAKEEEAMPILEEKRDIQTYKRQMMIPLSSNDNQELMMDYAKTIAESKEAEMMLMSVVKVPDHLPLSASKAFIEEAKGYIEGAQNYVESEIPIHSIIRYSHNIARAIISSLREKNTDFLFMKWKGYAKNSSYSMGSITEMVIERSPCDVILFKPGKENVMVKDVKRILIPSKGGYQNYMAISVAKALATNEDVEIVIYNVRQKNQDEKRVARRMQSIFGMCQKDSNLKIKIEEGRDVGKCIINESKNYDIVILGASNEGLLQHFLFGDFPNRIAKACDKHVLLVKKDLGVRSWFKRWLARRPFV